ncbi:MAG: class I SAM-dependent methyltransferase [Gemmatales bacterium]
MPAMPASLEQFMGKMLGDLGAAVSGALVVLGDRLGLYRALGSSAPMTAAELAKKTGTSERYLREWLAAQAASGYVTHLPGTETFTLSPEQKMVFADENSPTCMVGGYDVVLAMFHDVPKLEEAFRTGKGVGWHEHHQCLFKGTERFFRPGYVANLVSSWLPALTGVVEKLNSGAKVADVGCGHGASTILMAQAFPKSQFVGFDYHPASIDRAKQAAKEAGATNCQFEVADSRKYPGTGYDLVAFFDCLHDMGDPVGAAKHVKTTLANDGTWLIVEPFAHDTMEANMNPVGRIFYAASTMICVPASLSQEVGLGLGAQAGEKRLKEVITAGGFTKFRRATETPFNLIMEAKA